MNITHNIVISSVSCSHNLRIIDQKYIRVNHIFKSCIPPDFTRSEIRMRKHATPTIKSPHTPGRDTREIKQRRSEWRITKMVLAIFLSFVACYLPITIVKVADVEVKYPGIIKHNFYITVLKRI